MTLKFYYKQGCWYVDIPSYLAAGGSEADCQMVLGADDWIDLLSDFGTELWLHVDTEPIAHPYGRLVKDHTEIGWYDEYPSNHRMWLCEVTKFLFNEYPETIYYRILKSF